MTRLATLALVVAACRKDAPVEPAARPPTVTPPADAAVAPADAAARAIHELSVTGSDVLCFDGADCVQITATSYAAGFSAGSTTGAIAFDDGCSWQADRLTCGKTVTEAHMISGVEGSYLLGKDSLAWVDGAPGHVTHKPMRAFPGGITQLSAGFRGSCVLAGDGTVWCWSDPAKPTQVKVPANVVQIAVQEPFELCVLTKAGEVSCTPPFKASDNFACSARTHECGDGTVEQPDLTHPFDPLEVLTRPLGKLALAQAATSIVRDDGLLYVIDMDVLKLDPGDAFGACARGASAVACWQPCGKAWSVYDVKGLPADLADLSPDPDAGYALATSGEVWTWLRPACDAHVATAVKLDVPAIAQLAPALHVRSGPQLWTTTRCALTRNHDVTCWARDARGGGGKLVPRFDPLALARRHQP